MRSLAIFATTSLFSAAFLVAFAGDARADEPATDAPPTAKNAIGDDRAPAVATDQKDVATAEGGAKDDIKRWSIELNPIGVSIGRYSVQGEFMLAKHHAVTLNPFFQYKSISGTVNGQDVDLGTLSGGGAEAGYRFYTGSKGANGFFIGPSVLFAAYSVGAPSGSDGTSQTFTSVGGAVDLGGQVIIGPGIVIGAGFGLQYTATSEELDTDALSFLSKAAVGGGVRPRFLFAAGYSF